MSSSSSRLSLMAFLNNVDYSINVSCENLISALLLLGFDKVDSFLYTLVVKKYLTDENGVIRFNVYNKRFSNNFNKYVMYDGFAYRLKDGLSLDTNVCEIPSYVIPLRRRLAVNDRLLEYLKGFDFTEIVYSKMKKCGIDSIDEMDYSRFSYKEIEILKNSKPRSR